MVATKGSSAELPTQSVGQSQQEKSSMDRKLQDGNGELALLRDRRGPNMQVHEARSGPAT
jgi:hypothetical protein